MYRFIRYEQPLTASYRSSWNGLEQRLNSLFAATGIDSVSSAVRSIPVSVNEDKENLVLTAELPGVQRSDVELQLVDDVLSLSATRKIAGGEGEKTISFAREFNLPYPVQGDKVVAELKDGVLVLTLPKVEAVKPLKIAIN